ncbi:MAG TPA: nucleotide exchange factor GrpE [Candidatus Paceibacterota bacterium]|jgi:molecular chaperone GrpE|nr:nucleotide exchange factor GrpE [Candidatus Paceibacterota bacterium]HRS47720.1 nucleotide exchange factor GrpE [Candidatus Paceibacterota bacterium]
MLEKDDKNLKDNQKDNQTKENLQMKELIAKVRSLTDDLEKCQKEKEEYLNGWQRSRAEFINYQKREQERIIQICNYANENLISELLLVLDSLELAIDNSKDSEFLKTLNLLKSQFENILRKNGVELIKTEVNDKFDPEIHEAIETEKKENFQDNTIIEIISKGYKLNGKIIRPVKVKVAKN